MLKAKDLQIFFKLNNNKDMPKPVIRDKIAEILGKDLTQQAVAALRRLNIMSVRQLINKSGDKMIIWQQLKTLRSETNRGRIAKWFKKVEEILLENAETRQIKTHFMLPETNADALEIIIDKLLKNNHKKN